jgi:hypothetical protein
MADNFQGLVDVLPNIGSVYGEVLSVQGITGPQSLLGLVFPNAEQLFNTPWWAKFIENYLFKSPIKALLQDLNLNLFHEKFWSQPIPGLLNLGQGQARGR